MIVLDGSYGEGGGQIVRTALALSALTGQPFEIADIRKGRPNPGLKAQHVYCAKILQQFCSADAEGLEIGSERLLFIPGKLNIKSMGFDVGTAGSIPLLLQSALLPLAFSNKKCVLTLIGGTDVKWSMSSDYFMEVMLPQYRKFAGIDMRLLGRGYYPTGQGSIEITVKPKYNLSRFPDFQTFHKELKNIGAIEFASRGKLLKVEGVSHASISLQKSKVAERQAETARLALKKFSCPINIRQEYCSTSSPGSGIALWAVFTGNENSEERSHETADTEHDVIDMEIKGKSPVILGADALGERGKSSEEVGIEAAKSLAFEIESGACVDSHLADNLIPLLGILGGKIKTSKITEHCRTNIYSTEKFLTAKFSIEDNNLIRAEL